MQVDLLVRTQKFTDAKAILTDTFIHGLSKDNKPFRQLYRGIVSFKIAPANRVDGLDDLNAASAVRDSGLRHYYRRQMFDALKHPEDALADYQWLVHWSK